MKANSEKFVRELGKHLGDYRLNETLAAHHLTHEDYVIQAKFLNVALSFIMLQARSYELGIIPSHLYDLIRMCKQIKDDALFQYMEPDLNAVLVEKGREFYAG